MLNNLDFVYKIVLIVQGEKNCKALLAVFCHGAKKNKGLDTYEPSVFFVVVL